VHVVDGERRIREHPLEHAREHEAHTDRQTHAPAPPSERGADGGEEFVVRHAVRAADVVRASGDVPTRERRDDDVDQVVEEDGPEMPGTRADHRDHGQATDEAGELHEDAARPRSVDEARTEDGHVEPGGEEEPVRHALRHAVEAGPRQVDVLCAHHDDARAACRPGRRDQRARAADVYPVGDGGIEPAARRGGAEVHDGVAAGDGGGERRRLGEVALDDVARRRGSRTAPEEEAWRVSGGGEPRRERRPDEPARAGDEDPSHARSGAGHGARGTARRRSRPSGFPDTSP